MAQDFREKMKATIKEQLMTMEKEQLADVLAEYCMVVGTPHFLDFRQQREVTNIFDRIDLLSAQEIKEIPILYG